MKISKRLLSICELVDKDSVVADIGCDHGQLCCYLIQHNIISKAYACDVRQGPLNQAISNIKRHKLELKIHPVLCDGLDLIKDDVTAIVIAGMGFETIKKILENDFDKIQGKTFYIQSNRDVHKLRNWIHQHNFNIICEKCVYEDDHYYQIIKWDTIVSQGLNETELFLGKNVIIDQCYLDSLHNQKHKLINILKRIDETNDKYDGFNEELDRVNKQIIKLKENKS